MMKLTLALALFFAMRFSFACEVVTLTQPLLDYVLFVDEDFLKMVPGEKGGRELVDSALFSKLIDLSGSTPERVPGGSGTNVIKCLAHWNHKCVVSGKIGRDEPGQFYKAELERQGIVPRVLHSGLPTGRCAVFVTPDGERTMRTSLGAAAEPGPFPLHEEDFQDIRLLHFEGYLLFDKMRMAQGITLAKQRNALISLDLSSFEVVRAHKEMLPRFLEENIDILFCNEVEAFGLTGLAAQEACEELSKLCSVVAVTMGKKGAFVQQGSLQHFVPAYEAHTLDSTGAGDCFTGGFLHGYLNGLPIKMCAQIGALTAKEVVEVIGGQIPEERWEKIIESSRTSCQVSPGDQDAPWSGESAGSHSA